MVLPFDFSVLSSSEKCAVCYIGVIVYGGWSHAQSLSKTIFDHVLKVAVERCNLKDEFEVSATLPSHPSSEKDMVVSVCTSLPKAYNDLYRKVNGCLWAHKYTTSYVLYKFNTTEIALTSSNITSKIMKDRWWVWNTLKSARAALEDGTSINDLRANLLNNTCPRGEIHPSNEVNNS